jgi:hypothetical protein
VAPLAGAETCLGRAPCVRIVVVSWLAVALVFLLLTARVPAAHAAAESAVAPVGPGPRLAPSGRVVDPDATQNPGTGLSTDFDWATLVLEDGGWPTSSNNVTVITQWMASENCIPTTSTCSFPWWNRNNPLNNGLGSGGGPGLGSYSNLVIAAYYVALNLEASAHGYPQIAADLAASADPTVTATAIQNSDWAESHYGHGSGWHYGAVASIAAPESAWGTTPPPVDATTTSYTGATMGGFGDSVTLSAHLLDNATSTALAGHSVAFTLGTQSCSGTTDGSGDASCSLTLSQAPGGYTVQASFAGDASFTASSDSKPFTITRAATVTTVSAVPPGSAKFGQPVTFTAVTTGGASPGAASPTGSTAFTIDGRPAGSTVLVAGSASITTASLPAGPHTIDATYGGDANFLPSSGELAYTVTCDVNVSGTHQGALIVTTSTCLAAGAHVNGAVIVKPGGALDVEGATISGAIGATEGAGEIRVCGSTIGGAVDVKNSGGLVLVGDPADGCAPNTIGGALDVQNNTNGVEAIDNTVGGAILTDGNSGPGPRPGDTTTISGNHPPATSSPSTPGDQSAPPGTQGPQSAPQASPSAPPAAATTSSSGNTIPPTVSSTLAAAPVAGSPRVGLTAKRLTQAQKLAAAIHACGKLSKAKKQSCIATARKRYPLPAQKLKGSK